MNKVFKVIWSEARNAYVVVSEIAKNHGSKSCSTKKLLTMLIATGVMTCASMAPAMAANPAPDDLNVTIGKGAHVSVWNGVSGQTISGDIAVGSNAHAWNGEYTYDNQYARIGTKEYLMDFGQGAVETVTDLKWGFWPVTHYKVADGSKIAGSVAIGKNTVARTGSVMLGDHSYTGKLGDIEINPANAMTYNDGIYSTTLGAGAYNSGSLAAVTGALSIASGEDTKNTGATIYGSMNSIESATSNSSYSGVASSVLGFANRTQNANAALIWGTGNEVTNSVEDIGIDTNWNNVSVAEAQQKAIKAMQSSEYAGGSVMAIGGGNKADYAKYSQLTGVQNKVTGTKAKAAKYDFVNGYQNTVTNASDVTVIGIKNEVTADGNKVIGDNHKVSGKDNVIFGSADKLTETTVNNSVALGHNAMVTGEGGVALGFGSVADRANAVSVGSKGAERQITNVAAGTEDTDAVNVSQLKKATANANKGWKLSTEGGAANQVASEATVDFSGKKDASNHQNITVSNDGNNVKIDLASELNNVTGVVNGNSRVTLGTGIAGITNGQASVIMMNGSTTINGVVGIDNTGKISGVANGEADKDAVNYGQLKDVKAEALKHSTVTNGDNIAVTGTTNKDGGKEYKVALKSDIKLAGDTDFVSISGSKGTIWASGSVTAGSVVAGDVVMDSTTATVSGLSNKTTAYAGFATTGKAATEEQLKEVATEAGKHTQVKAGTNVRVDPGETADGTHVYTVNADGTTVSGDSNVVVTAGAKDENNVTNYGVKLNKDLKGIESVSNGSAKLALNGAAGTVGIVNGKGASIFMMDNSTVINNVVGIDKNGKITGVANGEDDKDAVNYGQLKDVKAEAGKHTTLSDGKNTTVESTVKDGKTDYKVNVAGDLTDITSVADGDAKLALNGAAGYAGIINGKGASVYLQDGYTKINNKVIIDQDGKISGVAAGKISADSTDAVNGSQLNAVATEAGKHSKVVNGTNTNVEESTVDGQKVYKVNLNDNIMVGDVTGKYVSISGTNGTIEATGAIATKDRVYADKGAKLADIDVTGNTISNGDAKLALNGAAGTAGIINGQGASVYMQGSTTVINSKVSVDKDGKVTATAGEIGNVVLQNGVYTGHSALRDGELFVGDASGNYSQITTKGAKLGKVTVAEDGKISGVAAGAVTADSTDAVNGSQLHAVATEASKHSKVVGGNNISVEETDVDGQKFYKVNMNKDIILGDLTGKYVNISGTNGTIETTGYIATQDRVYADKGAKLADIDVTGNKISNGASSIVLDGSNVKVNDKVTIDQNGKISGVAAGEVSKTSTDAINGSQLNQTNENVAALDKRVTANAEAIEANKNAIEANKGAIEANKNAIQENTNKINKLDERVTDVEALAKKHTTVINGANITVTEDTNKEGGKNYKVNLNKDIMVGDITGKYVSISGTNGTIEATGAIATKDRVYADKGAKLADIDVTGNKISNGASSIVLDGSNVKVNDKVTIDQNGKVTGVADGDVKENSKDAVNGSQLYKTNQEVFNNTNRINQLGSRVNKVGAGAAALAALHPMDFDPDDKLTFSAGYGNYGGENAAAIGAYYRPDEKVMFSIGGTVGNGENMVNAGVSFSLDRTNHVSNSRTAMAREILDLRAEVTELKAMVAKGGLGSIAEDKMKIFPDVAENHWAYEYVGKLAAAGIIEGYPDGKFSGDRMMSRYEFAAMLYRAMQKGAQLDSKIINEFAPEMGRIRVDRISGEDGDRDKIERVRVNAVKGERDHYGNKLAK